MATNFHEQFSPGATPVPSERSTGFVFAIVSVVVAYLWRANASVLVLSVSAALTLVALSVMAPHVLRPLNLLWFRIGIVLHRIVNPMVMLLLFVVIIVPAGLIMRIWHDPLRVRRAAPHSTYWIERQSGSEHRSSMANQF